MNGKQLKNSILQWAIQGKLVPQDPNDEPASVLLEKIRQEKERLIKEKKIKRDKNASIIYRGEDNSYYEKFLATGEVKCIDEEIPFEIPQGWEWCRLGEISTYAQTKKKINAANADVQLWGLDLEDIEKGGKLLYRKTVGERKAIGDKTIFNRGDILYSKLRPYLLKVLIAPESGICTPEIIPFTCYGNICKEYIVGLLKSPYVDEYINAVTYGVKMPRVGTETMTSLLVPFPPISEQLRIVVKTEQLMKHVDKYGKIQDKLDCLNEELPIILRKSVLQDAIQGKLVPQIESEGTAKELLEQIQQTKQKLVKEGKLKKSALEDSVIYKGDDNKYYEQTGSDVHDITDSIPFDIPSNWNWCRLKDICSIFTGATFKKEDASTENKGVRVLRGGNILPFELVMKPDDLFLPCTKIKESILLRQNDIVTPAVTSLENIGKAARVQKDLNDVTVGGFVFILRSFLCNDWLSQYLLALLGSPSMGEYMKSVTNKSGQAFYNIGKERLAMAMIPLPPLKEQQRIVAQIERLFEQLK